MHSNTTQHPIAQQTDHTPPNQPRPELDDRATNSTPRRCAASARRSASRTPSARTSVAELNDDTLLPENAERVEHEAATCDQRGESIFGSQAEPRTHAFGRIGTDDGRNLARVLMPWATPDLELITSLSGVTPDQRHDPDERGQWFVLAASDEGRVLALTFNVD